MRVAVCVGLAFLAAIPVLALRRAGAETPPADAIVRRMKAALEPASPSMRKLVIRVSSQRGGVTEWLAGQASKRVGDDRRMVTVVLAPEAARGIAWLLQEGSEQTVQWVWTPAIGRVRKIIPLEGYQAFLSSDFTYADLGLVDMGATYKLLGEEPHGGVRAYKVEATPRVRWYYARIVNWVAADTGFPLERDFYDPSNTLWKVETFQQVSHVEGAPTLLRFRMEDQQEKGSTEIEVSGVRYGSELPDALFEPGKLPETATSPLWKSVDPD